MLYIPEQQKRKLTAFVNLRTSLALERHDRPAREHGWPSLRLAGIEPAKRIAQNASRRLGRVRVHGERGRRLCGATCWSR